MPNTFEFHESLKIKPFLVIIGKYDHILGPKPLYTSHELTDNAFVERVLRDALHTKSKYITLDFDTIYAQGNKIEVEDPEARGKKQLYVIILLRDSSSPPMPIIHFKRIEMLFHKIPREIILMDDPEVLKDFFKDINEIYINKKEILPLESLNLQIRSGLNTIQGFCELILDEKESKGKISEQDVLLYVKMMLDSCKEITKAVDESFS